MKNKTKKPKYSSFNQLFPSSTTWKYPTPIYDGAFHQFNDSEQIPDHKMFFLIIATPLTGLVHDPGQAQHGFVINEDGTHDLYPARAQFECAGSIVDERFGPPQPVAGPSKQPDVEVIEEEGQPKTILLDMLLDLKVKNLLNLLRKHKMLSPTMMLKT